MPLRPKIIRPVLDRLVTNVHAIEDAEALRRYHRQRDEEAFAQLVRRYVPLVTGVCRRVLGPRPEADDAVQATFWTLARKAGSIRQAKTLPAWLHAVAYRTARKAATESAPPPDNLPVPTAPDDPLADASWREVRRLLDAEVHRLPPRLKLPILLCYFEDLTRDEAADRLGWSLSTVKRRLDQARGLLKARLVRRGVGPGLLGATTLLTGRLTARVSPALESACARLAHQPPEAAVRALSVAPPVAGTAKWLAAAVAVGGLGWGIVALAGQTPKPDPKAPPAEVKEKETPSKAGEVAEPLPSGALARFGTVRYRASMRFWSGSYSKDGRWFVSGTDGVELWNLDTGLPRQLMPVRNNTVPRPRISPDGSLVAVLDGGPGIHLFDQATGKELRALGAKESFAECQFTPDGKRVVGIAGGLAKGFDARTGAEVFATAAAGNTLEAWNDRPVFFVVGAGKDGALVVRVADVETGKDLKTFETGITDFYKPKEPDPAAQFRTGISIPDVMRYAVAPNLSHLAYQRADARVAVVALAPGAKPRVVELTSGLHPTGLKFAPDSKSLFAFDLWGGLTRSDVATGKLLGAFSGGLWHVDPDAKVLTSAGQDGLIRRWDLTTNREISLATGFHKAVQAVFTSRGSRVIVGDRMGTIDVFDARTGRKVQEVPRWRDGTDWYTFAVSPDGRTLVATRPEGKMFWWDLAAGKELAATKISGPVPDQHFHSVQGMVFTPDGRRLVCSHVNSGLFAVDTETRKEVWRVGVPTDRDYDATVALTVSADGRHVARGMRRGGRTGDWGYGLQVLDTATGRPVKIVDVSESKGKDGLPDLMDVRYTSDGRFLALVSRNGRVQVRHADSLAELSSWTTGSKYTVALDVSPDGRLVSTGDDAGTVKVWELLTGKMVASVRGHRGTVASVQMSLDGKLLATGGYDQVAYTWSLKPAAAPDRPLERLAGESAEDARAAIWAIAADPDGPNRLRERVPPVVEPKPETIQGWIADLDHATFARRETASAALTRAAVVCEPAMRRALQDKPTAEARERLTKVLTGITRRPSRDDVTHSRAVQAMELANTAAARKVLEEWASGVEGAWLTIDARAALERLRARGPAE
ncbi:MAG TPA: sigma-70 family RNA polymerase sigma factor [Gemmataceae bacterium]|nr:sigma-70 family RNA polymerase sigma factor [Gemmataceae bacterium]